MILRMLNRTLQLLAIVSLVTASASGAATSPPGVNIRWDRCFGDGGVVNKTFACDTNAGQERLVLSFVLDSPLDQMISQEFVVDLVSPAPLLPAWWQLMNPFFCRQTALSASFGLPPGSTNCVDWSNGQATGGIGSYYVGPQGSNSASIYGITLPTFSGMPTLDPGVEYLTSVIEISHASTVGFDACNGCTQPVCILFQSLRLHTPYPFTDERILIQGANGQNSQLASWQNGSTTSIQYQCDAHTGCRTFFGCVLATPTESRGGTWGQVKALYR